ncbi:hypothetical protein NHQ30_009533 [Ciborinia camelliae]|nr:hypothetical protein NHQ30_009533 [Ciborinia camelliae]
MPYLNTAQEWLTQSSLLLKAHPTTTRITTKYTLLHASSSAHAPSTTHSTASKPRLPKPSPPTSENPSTPTEKPTATAAAPDPPRATLTLTTFHPPSGVNLKYATNKAAEVSRLIQIMGRLGRLMAGLPEEKEQEKEREGLGLGEISMGEAQGVGAAPVVVETGAQGEEEKKVEEKKGQGQGQGQVPGSTGGKGKKKKGKK